MLNRKKALARGLAGCFLLACANIAAAVGSGPKSIAKVEVTDIFFTIYFSDGAIPNTGCDQADKVVYWRSDFPNSYNSLLSTALTAFATGKKVEMWVAGCRAGPWAPSSPSLPIPQSVVATNG